MPAIIEAIPYRRRDATAARDERLHPHVARRGYACLRLDLRGSGDSEGILADEYPEQELRDICEVVGWLSAQPWCDGGVGMIGISWGGFNALQTAARDPEPLKAVIAVAASDNRFTDDIHYKGGALLTANFTWSQTMLADLSRPPDPAVVGDRWRETWRQRVESAEPFAERWHLHQQYDDYWRHGSVSENYGAIRCPVLAVAGWADCYVNFVPRLAAGLETTCKGITGPWAHDYPHTARPGPGIDFLHECLRWWDRWLKGFDTGVEAEPDWRVYLQTRIPPEPGHQHRQGRWIGVPAWPPLEPPCREFHLGRGGLDEAPGPASRVTVASPQTVGSASGEFCPYGHYADQPDDQQRDDAASAVFDTDPLAAPLILLGAPILDLAVTVEPDMFVVARLEEVTPDGRSSHISCGVGRAHARRESTETPNHGPAAVRIELNHTAYEFSQGRRVRLALSTAYWPLFWPPPEHPAAEIETAGSRLTIPLAEEATLSTASPAFGPPLVPEPETVERVSEGTYSREVAHDPATGVESLAVTETSGVERSRSHGLEWEIAREEVFRIRPDEPLSATLDVVWTTRLARDDWRVETRTRASMQAAANQFRILARLETFENEKPMFENAWDILVPRQYV